MESRHGDTTGHAIRPGGATVGVVLLRTATSPAAIASLVSVAAPAPGTIDLSDLGRRIVQAAYLEGDFLLRSGRRSRYYLDKFLFATNPALLRDLGAALAARLPEGVQRIAGPELGAVPLATATALASGIPSVLIRGEAKTYGTLKRFEGALEAGERVALIEDVVTSGGQVIESATALRDFGAEVVRVLVVIDREEGAGEALRQAGFSFEPLFTRTSLGLAL